MIKILIADDMRNFLDLEISFLRRTECEIVTAKDGLEALKLVKKNKPDIILLDLEMPKMTGIEVTRIIKSDEKLKNIPIIIVTSYPRKDECLRAGADDFLQKPITEEQLLKEIKKFVPVKDRTEDRVAVSVLVVYRYKNKTYAAYTRDLSTVGIFIVTRDLVPIGSSLKLELELAHPRVEELKKIKIKGEVVRQEKTEEGGYLIGGMGVRFLDLDEKDKAEIKKFLDTVSH